MDRRVRTLGRRHGPRNGVACCQGTDGNQHRDHRTAAHQIRRYSAVGPVVFNQTIANPASQTPLPDLQHENANAIGYPT
jgi:hypothetical protein